MNESAAHLAGIVAPRIRFFGERESEREEMIKQRGGRILYASSLLRPPSFLDHQFLGREEEKVWRLLPDLCARTKEEKEKYAE